LIQVRAGLSVAVQNARSFLLLAIAACGAGQTAPPSGSLNLAVSGLPSGVVADVTVSGPNGFNQRVGESQTLSGLAAGGYTISAAGVPVGPSFYAASPPSQSISVTAGDFSSADVLYGVANGSLVLTVAGLPSGVDAAISVSGPGGYSHPATASETLTGLAPGQYAITALPVTDGSEQYSPAPSSQTATVDGSGSVSATVNYSTGGAAGFNLRVDGLYLVQSVQTFGRGVPLVRDRNALLRVFVTANQVNTSDPGVRVRLFSNGSLISTQSIPAPGLATPLGPDEGSIDHSWNLVIDKSLIQPNLSILVDVDPDGRFPEGDETDNVFPASGGPLNLEVRTTDPFDVRFIPVITKADGRKGNVTAANRDRFLDDAMRMHPLSSFDADLRSAYTTTTTGKLETDNGNQAWNTILHEILTRQMAEGSERYYYGVVNPGYSSGVAGVGYIGAPAAIGWDRLPSGSSVAAHEWGHNWKREHAPCGGASDPDDAFPYPGGEIGVVGYDLMGGTLKPADSHDLMGYCGDEWISDYTFKGVMTFRHSEGSLAGGMAEAIQPSLLVWGRIESGRVVLEPAFRVTTRPHLPNRPGPYRLEGRAADGSRVFGFDFAPLEVADDPNGAAHFSFVVPLRDDRAARLASLHLDGAGVRASAAQASSEPTAVEVTPGSGGRVRLRWDATRAPMIMVRDPLSGDVLSFARGGSAEVAADGDELALTVSDRVRSRDLRVRARSR
jgi:hypothetical protein